MHKTSCPYHLLGKGMGPLPYNELYSRWARIDQQVDFDPKHSDLVMSLNKKNEITLETMVEGVLSERSVR